MAAIVFFALAAKLPNFAVTSFYVFVILHLLYLKYETNDVLLHPLFLFSLTYIFLIFVSYARPNYSPEILFLYFSCYIGYALGWHAVSTSLRLNINTVKIVYFKPFQLCIIVIVLLFIAYHVGSGFYLALIASHVGIAAYFVYTSSPLKYIFAFVAIIFSFLLGKVILLRLFVYFFFIDRYVYEQKRPVYFYLLILLLTFGLFILFNFRRYILEGNAEYIDIDMMAFLNFDIILKLLIAGSDYFWSLGRLVDGNWFDFGSYGSTYVSGLLKILPQSFFVFRPDSGNFVMNSFLFSDYEKNSLTMAATFVGELYINFGMFAFFGAFVLGLFLKQVYLKMIILSKLYSNGWLFLASFYALQFSLVRDDFNVSFGTFILYLFVIILTMRRVSNNG